MVDCDSERIWKIVESYRQNVPKRRHQSDSPPSLFDRLYDCYVECNQMSSEKSADKRFRNAVNLLERLSPSHAHPSLIVNLYPDEKGYSLVLSPKKGSESEEFFLPYEDNEIFSYLDNQELPPVLVEVLGQTKHCHMYNGCIVCEVRDHRSFSCPNGSYDRHLLLLRPTTETILSTVEEMAVETGCSAEEKLFLESKLLLATQPPICLDPSTDVVCFTNRLQYNQRKFHTPAIRRTLRRRSHARRARMHMTSEGVAPRGLQLHDFITERTKTQPRERRREVPNYWKKPKIDLQLQDTPETILASVLRHAKRAEVSPLESPFPTTTSRPPSLILGRQPSAPAPVPAPHQHLEERETQSLPVSVPNEVTPVQGHPPHPPITAPLPPSHPQIPPNLPTTPAIIEQQIQQPPIHHPPRLVPPTVTPPPLAPPTTTPPSVAQMPIASIAAVPPLTTAVSTTITPQQASQPPPLTPTPPPLVQQQVPPAPITPPISVAIATPAISQPPQQVATSQPILAYNPGGLQLPPGIAASPELFKQLLAQMQMQAAATAAIAAAGRQNKPRPIAPASSVAKVTSAAGGGAPVVVKSKSPVLSGNPPPLSGAAGSNAAAAVVMSRPGGSTVVQVSPQVRPPLHSLTTPTPPSLTPSPKRPLPSLASQNLSPGQAGMPKLHPLAQDSSVSQKSSLPPQPALNKPTIPPPPSLSASVIPGSNTPPPAMPMLHKISTPMPPPQVVASQQVQVQQKATPTVGGAMSAPPLKVNPTSTMPKLTTSLGQQVKLTHTGLPVLSRAPMTLQPPPGSKPHPQPGPLTPGAGVRPQPRPPLTHPQQAISSSSGFRLAKTVTTVGPPKLLTGTAAGTSVDKPTKQHGSSLGKAGKSHGSGTKKKKK